MRHCVVQYGKLKPPKWSDKAKASVRACLPRLTIGGLTEIKLDTGVYYLTMKYENHSKTPLVEETSVTISDITDGEITEEANIKDATTAPEPETILVESDAEIAPAVTNEESSPREKQQSKPGFLCIPDAVVFLPLPFGGLLCENS